MVNIISIHAPREGSDSPHPELVLGCHPISIHAPREGSDFPAIAELWQVNIFQSTLPVRGATQPPKLRGKSCGFQSTLPVRGATVLIAGNANADHISIHAPREGSDDGYQADSLFSPIFQSTLPVRGATGIFHKSCRKRSISIHAPREGSDSARGRRRRRRCTDFNPRSP